MLTPPQTKAILTKLKAAGIVYDEVYIELLDHFASAIEQKMQEGMTFEQALKEVEEGFGGSRGIKQVEDRYFSQLIKLYWQNIRQQFQWPQVAGTFCMSGMVYALSHLLKGSPFLVYGLATIAFIPYLMGVFSYFRYRRKATFSRKSAKGTILVRIGDYSLNLLLVFIIIPRIFFPESLKNEQFLFYPALVSALITLYLLHLLSFIKTLQRVKPQAI